MQTLPGPPSIAQALANKCFRHVGKDSNGDDNMFTVCGFLNVKQGVMNKGLTCVGLRPAHDCARIRAHSLTPHPLRSFNVGQFSKWLMAPGEDGQGSGKFAAQLYDRGDPCGSVDRITTVVFLCDRNLTEPKLRSAAEVEVCSYEVHLALPEWCEAEEKGEAGKYVFSPRKPKT